MENKNDMMKSMDKLINELNSMHDSIVSKDTDEVTEEEAHLYFDMMAGFYSEAMLIPIETVLKQAATRCIDEPEYDEFSKKIIQLAINKTISALIDKRNNLEGYYFNNESIHIE